MTTPVAVVGLAFRGDLQRSDLDVFFEITEGLDTLPEVRGEDQLIPFRSGNLPGLRMPHRRSIVAVGHVMGTSGNEAAAFRAYLDELKGWLDPMAGEAPLIATLEDGTTRWITCVPRNIMAGETHGRGMRSFSLEWEAVSDPLWHASNGYVSLDSGLLMDDAWLMDQDAIVRIIPTADPYLAEFFSLGTTDVEAVRIEIDGPSSALRVGNLNTADFINFTYPALTAGQTLVVDSGLRVVTLNGAQARALLGLGSNNRHGEYFRLRPGSNTLQVLGQPAQVRVYFTPAFL